MATPQTKIKKTVKHDSLNLTVTFANGQTLRYFRGRSSEKLETSSWDSSTVKHQMGIIQKWLKPAKEETLGDVFNRLETTLQGCDNSLQFMCKVMGREYSMYAKASQGL